MLLKREVDMISIKNSVMVNRPIEEVSEYITELSGGLKCAIEAKSDVNQEFSYSCDMGPIPERGNFMLEPYGGNTRITFALQLETGRLLGLMKPIIMPIARWQLRQSLAKVKDRIEAGA